MIPRRTVLHNFEPVYKTVIRGNRALSNAIDAIHLHGIQLPNTVPVYRSSIEIEFVVDNDLNSLPVALANER